MTDVWPYDLLTPRGERARLQGVAMMGGQSAGGTSQSIRLDGGGLWVIEQDFLFASRIQIKAARAVEAILDGGATSMIVRVSDQPYAPSGLATSNAPFSDDATFSDGSEFLTVPPGAVTTALSALRATTLPVSLNAGSLEGGERFSIVHPTKGKRLYVVMRVGDGEITIRPPLREAAAAGTELDFLTPGCVCRLANADDFFGAMGPDRLVEASAVWVEAFA